MEKVTYNVICPYDKEHTFPIVLKVKDKNDDIKNTIETYCPFCDKYVRVEIDKELVPDKEVFRKYGFED